MDISRRNVLMGIGVVLVGSKVIFATQEGEVINLESGQVLEGQTFRVPTTVFAASGCEIRDCQWLSGGAGKAVIVAQHGHVKVSNVYLGGLRHGQT